MQKPFEILPLSIYKALPYFLRILYFNDSNKKFFSPNN